MVNRPPPGRRSDWSGHRTALRTAVRLCLAGSSMTTVGCAGGWQVDTVADPAFAPAEVQSVAVLPWFDWALGVDEAREAADRVVVALERSDRKVRVVAPGDAADLIAASGLAYEWALFLYDRREEAAADSTVVMRIGDALGTDLLAHITLLDVFQHDGSDELGSAYTSVLVQVELFDTRSGSLAWAGSCGIAHGEDPLHAPPVRQPMWWALDAVLAAMPHVGSKDLP